jgi:hypothetical protein
MLMHTKLASLLAAQGRQWMPKTWYVSQLPLLLKRKPKAYVEGLLAWTPQKHLLSHHVSQIEVFDKASLAP